MWTSGYIYIYFLLLLSVRVPAAYKGAVRDYCDADTFHAQCTRQNEVIIMEHAKYGRMRANKCDVSAEKGNVGCSADVLYLMDEKCSGLPQCHITNIMSEFSDQNECDSELRAYLEAAYSCIEVRSDVSMCETDDSLFLQDTVTHLSSLKLSASNPDCSSSEGRTLLALPAGQQLNISLINLSLGSNRRYGFIKDAQTQLEHELRGGQERQQYIWLSNSNRVELRLQFYQTEMPKFILVLTAIGCKDIEPLDNASFERHGETTTMKCVNSEKTYELNCKNNQWVGIVGNCSDDLHPSAMDGKEPKETGVLPPDITVALIASAGFIISVAIIATGVNCWRRNSLATQLAQMQEKLMKQERGEEGADSEYMFPIYKGATEDALYDFCFTPANKGGTAKVVQVPVSGTAVRATNSERTSLLSATIERNLLPTVDENSMLVSQPCTLPVTSRSPPKESHYKTLIVRQNDNAMACPAATTTTTTTSCPKAPPRSANTLPPVPSPAAVPSPSRPIKPPPRAIQTLPPPPPPVPELDTPTEALTLPLPPPPPPITDEDSDDGPVDPIPTMSASNEGSPVNSQGSTDSTPASALDNMATLPLRGEPKQNTISNSSHRTFTKTSDIGHMYAVPEKCLYENLKTAKKA